MLFEHFANLEYDFDINNFVSLDNLSCTAGLPPVQEFVVRNDCGCGSTIGPIISSNTGIRAIDLGCPQLAMHSIRETMGSSDVTNGLNLFKAFFKHFREVDESIMEEH